MKRLLVATAIALLILAFTATAALAHGRHAGQDLGGCEQDCAEYCTQVAGGRRRHVEGYHFGQDSRSEVSDPTVRVPHPAISETFTGQVIEVYQTASKQGQGTGLHLSLKTDAEILDVHLGPEWYLDQQDFNIEPGDSLHIQGARFTKDDKSALIAFEMKQADQILSLRDRDGVPQWKNPLPPHKAIRA